MTKSIAAAFAAVLLASASPLPAALMFAPTAAQAQSAVTFENVSIKGDFGTLTIPKISIEGTNATRADIEGLFDPKATATVADRVAKISARSISIPSIEIRQSVGEFGATTTYRDTILRDVRNGVIGEMVTPTASVSGKARDKRTGKTNDIELTSNNVVLKQFDLALMLKALFGKGEANEPLKMVAAEQSLGRTTVKIGTEATAAIAGISVRDFKMRALPKPMLEVFAEAERNEKEKAPGWEKKNLALMGPIMSAMAIGTMEVSGVTADIKPADGKGVGTFGLDKMTMSGASLVPERFAMQGFRMDVDGVKVRLGEFAFDGLDTSGMAAAMQSGDMESDPAKLIPKLALVRFGGIDIDVPDTKNPGQRIKAKLGLFETKMANHVGAIPANIMMALDRLQMDIPANTKEKGLQDILALGYKAVDLSARYDQTWNEAAKTLKLNEFSIGSAGMFQAKATADIGNVTRELFNTDKAVAAVAALGVLARNVDVHIVNSGLFQKLIEKQAKDSRRKVEDVRAEFAAGATLMAPMFMGDHPAAKVIGQVLGKFIADPKNLKVTVTAKEGGLGATDFMAAGNPM
ncbi:MAG: hypothetical protein ACRCTI_08835, partial [Beijerinckiaceae bacterium]